MIDKISFIKNNLTIKQLLAKMSIVPNKGGFIKSIYKTEKTPSLKIYFDDNSYYCFATSQGGDIIKFYKDYYNLEMSKAIDDLYRIAGGSDVQRENIAQVKPVKDKTDVYSALTNEERMWFDEIAALTNEKVAVTEIKLHRLKNNTKIFTGLFNYCQKYYAHSFHNYLMKDRMLNETTIQRFKLFYIENYFEVNQHLKKTFDLELLKASGLVNEKGNLIFAKHRLIIPYIYNDQIVYLRGRYFDAGDTNSGSGPKYIGLKNDALNVNTSKRLWNADVIGRMTKGDKLFITEGEFDAMILEQEGIFAAAIPGVGNIPSDKWFLKMVGLRVAVLTDNDEAGAALRNILNNKLAMYGIETENYYLLNYKDISEFAKSEIK